MDFMILTQVGGILKPFAWIFGQIFNLLYELLRLFNIENVAFTVVLFTIVAKMLMMPLTIRQQKFSKLSSKMQPELSEITAKYKGKKDEKSMRLSQLEQQAVYEKYGTSPTAGCLPLLISLPVMFALYRVIYAIPAYVKNIGELYDSIAVQIKEMPDYFIYMTDVAKGIGVSTSKFTEVAEEVLTNEHLIDIMTKFGTEQWNALYENFPGLNGVINGAVDKIISINSLWGDFNILNSPSNYGFSLALLIPVLAVVTQLAQSLMMKTQTNNNKKTDDNPMAQSMNSMMYVMPFMSGFFCWSFPICVGIYWVISTVVTIVQQFFINRHIDKMDLNEMIQKNVEKQNKRRAKMGIEQGSKMAELAKTQTKSINTAAVMKEKGSASSYANASGKKVSASSDKSDNTASEIDKRNTNESKSIAGYANLLKKNSDKGEK